MRCWRSGRRRTLEARSAVGMNRAPDRESLGRWFSRVISDPAYEYSDGGWHHGGCYLLARAVRDCLKEAGWHASLVEYSRPGLEHVACVCRGTSPSRWVRG